MQAESRSSTTIVFGLDTLPLAERGEQRDGCVVEKLL